MGFVGFVAPRGIRSLAPSVMLTDMRQDGSHDGLSPHHDDTEGFQERPSYQPRINVALSLTTHESFRSAGDCGGGLFNRLPTWVRVIVTVSHSNPRPDAKCPKHLHTHHLLISEPKLRDLLGLGLRLGGSREGFDYSPRFRFGPREFAISYVCRVCLNPRLCLCHGLQRDTVRGGPINAVRRPGDLHAGAHGTGTVEKTSVPGNCGSEGD